MMVWCHGPTLCGVAAWGRLVDDDTRELTQLLELSLHPALAAGFDVVLDSTAVEFVEWSAYSILAEYVNQQLAQWTQLIRHQAAVLPAGPLGFMLGGMVPSLGGADYPQRFFATLAEAIGWLDRADLVAAVEEVAGCVARVRGMAPVLRALRECLARTIEHVTVKSAARALGSTPRSLQRELQRAGTSFSAELAEARVRAASELLLCSDEKIEVIARQVGCASSSQLSLIMRRSTGQTPAQFRALHRKAPDQ